MIWYSHLFQNFPQFIVIHTVKGFGIDNKTEVDVFVYMCVLSINYFCSFNPILFSSTLCKRVINLKADPPKGMKF